MTALIKKAVTTISTCTEGDPKVGETMATLRGLDSELAARSCLAGHLKSPEANTRRAAIYILWMGQFDDIAAGNGRTDEALFARRGTLPAAWRQLALGSKKVESSYDKLAEMTLKDKSGYARRCAAIALGWMGRPDAKDVLEKAKKDEDGMVRANAEAALKLLQQAGEKAPAVVATNAQGSHQ